MSAERLLPRPAVSIVVPVYNEEDSLPQLYREVAAAMDSIGRNAELILVDDGSTDRTTRLAGEIAARDSRVLVILLRRNFGQTPALQAGIDQARGEIVITMDGDLQNDPADIPLFLEKLEEGCDIVCGWRKNRKDNLWHRKIPSWAANRLLRLMTGVNIHDSGCSLKAYRGSVIRNARLYSDLHRFIPAITSLSGARVGEIVVHHRARKFGQTKYGISRTWKVLADLWMIKMIVGFITRPGSLVRDSRFALVGDEPGKPVVLLAGLLRRRRSRRSPDRATHRDHAVLLRFFPRRAAGCCERADTQNRRVQRAGYYRSPCLGLGSIG